jgi:hypothetical protein
MPINCYSGIEVPATTEAPCGGNIISTDCIASPNANSILDLPSGASQTETNAALTTAILYKEQQIEDLQNSILIIDGSETKVEAGDNITVTGAGTNLSPYIVNASSGGNQDLQSVLNFGSHAESLNTLSEIDFDLSNINPYVDMFLSDENGDNTGQISINPSSVKMEQISNSLSSKIQIENGAIDIIRRNFDTDKTSVLNFAPPLVNSTFLIPSKAVDGNYTIATLDDIVDSRPYKTCSLLLSQVGTTAPTFTILENTLGDTFTIIYNGVGSYTLRLNTLSLFTSTKTSILVNSSYNSSSYLGVNRGNDTDLLITTTFSGSNANNVLVNATLEVKVYN